MRTVASVLALALVPAIAIAQPSPAAPAAPAAKAPAPAPAKAAPATPPAKPALATTPVPPAAPPVALGNEPELSRAQNTAIAKSIAGLKTPEERRMATGWSNAKKVAEVICRPAALPALKKQVPNADRVFLGTDDPKTLTLVSTRSLTGAGQVRSGSSWRDFTFTCALMPSSGKVAGFTAVLKPVT
ncbi:hypothetical protein LJR164_003681 [Phenylobacterium sp. LjRoot164]|uniref:hypothetical protein n=1 Tax=unclassified Phenylobacterium TaxID=2640670 RepID=UPI003ECE67F9